MRLHKPVLEMAAAQAPSMDVRCPWVSRLPHCPHHPLPRGPEGVPHPCMADGVDASSLFAGNYEEAEDSDEQEL